MSNDDRLFPGRMDTQIIGDDGRDSEWAVDRIKSHSGSKTDAVFEIIWKSGDITWMPYYQITHLQALTDYLDLLGVSRISKLPPGPGQPPSDDPQVFSGSMDLEPSTAPFLFCTPIPDPSFLFKRLSQSATSLFQALSSRPFTSTTVDLEFSIVMPALRGVKHPILHRLSATHYTLREPQDSLSRTIHVGQIADYLKFDEQLRAQEGLDNIQTMPLGYSSFSALWNDYASDNDSRRLSGVYVPEDANRYHVEISSTPVHIADFFITPEQVGIMPSNPEATTTSKEQDEIVKEFATVMMEQRRNSRRGFEKRQQQRLHPFKKGSTNQSAATLSKLQFKAKLKAKEKHQKRKKPSPLKRSPSPTQSDEEHVDKVAPPPVEGPVEMETGN